MLPSKIIQEIENNIRALSLANDEYKTKVVTLAKVETQFDIAYAKKIIVLREIDKVPVNLVTILAKGDKDISALSLQKRMAERDCETTKMRIRSVEVELDMLRSILSYDKTELKTY